MKKRLFAGLLAALMLAVLPPAAAAKSADVPEREKAAVLRELEIMVGDLRGDLQLDRAVTRAEFTKMTVAASPYKDMVSTAASTDPYPDVSHRDWYAPYVRLAADTGLVKGDLEGWFRPQRTITLAEGVTMALRLLGWQDADFNSPWPTGQIALYRSLEMDGGVNARDPQDPLTRRDCLHLFYNLLCVSTKSGTPYVNLLGAILNKDAEVDLAALFKVELEGPIPLTRGWEALLPFDPSCALIQRDGDRAELSDLREWDLLYWAKDQAILFAFPQDQTAMGQLSASLEGPVLAAQGWEGQLPFDPAGAVQVVRDGQSASPYDIRQGDVVYWSKYAKSLHVYSVKVRGIVESISPSLAAPAAVTVAGRPYPLETLQAQYALSDFGPVNKGDLVTLHLGRSGGVAFVEVLSGEEAAASPQVGVLTALSTGSYTDNAGNLYTSKTVTLTAADGLSYTYPFNWDKDKHKAGDLVSVTVTDSGTALIKAPKRPVSGRISEDGSTLGRTPIARNIAILDLWEDTGARSVPLSRLQGVTLTDAMVRYHEVNPQGEIDLLVLNDVTGDGHIYGVVTDVKKVSVPGGIPGVPMALQGVYTLDIMGQSQIIPSENKVFPVDEGPALLKLEGTQVKALRNLTQLKDITLTDTAVWSGGKVYTLSDAAVYYIRDRGEDTYTFSTKAQLAAGDYLLSAWYDSPDAAGGRVRVVLGEIR